MVGGVMLRAVLPIFLSLVLLCGVLAAAQDQSTSNTIASLPTTTSVTAPQPKAAKTYHDGSLRDIDAIGNRKVGCERGLGNWYSLEKQIDMGRGYARQIESTTKVVTDPEITEYVNRIGQNLVRNSDAEVPFTIKVVDTDDINAFALPGGFLYVDSGLILAADEEAELAGVMAHEISRGHVRNLMRHHAGELSLFIRRQNQAQIGRASCRERV